jgi:selenocysteine lyase/cysteine desulfurase
MSEADATWPSMPENVLKAMHDVYEMYEKQGGRNLKPWSKVVADLEEADRKGERIPFGKIFCY